MRHWLIIILAICTMGCARYHSWQAKAFYNHGHRELQSISKSLAECPDKFSADPPEIIALDRDMLGEDFRAAYNQKSQTIMYEKGDYEILWHEMVHHVSYTEGLSRQCIEQMLAVTLYEWLSTQEDLFISQTRRRAGK